MITLRKHIELMQHIQSGDTVSNFMESMKPLEALDFSRASNKTYPIQQNVKRPSVDKKIYTTVESLVLGQFIMLEQIITRKTKLADHLIDFEIAKLLIRPSNHILFDNEDVKEEKANEQDILDMDVLEVYWVLDKFIENRNKTLFEDFSGVFYDVPDEDEEQEEQTQEEKTSEMMFNQQWYWYSIVRMLGNEDITKYSEIYMLNMATVLPEMSFLAQRSKIESAKERQRQAMSKL
jgi:hypothetical protein